ncbi:MAG: tetratricopeptide repeat protein, partial [Gammaproteobacteria bacterium]|nr:tetratricopeptide repeat protein [Gammaproteobacteria bacterium]
QSGLGAYIEELKRRKVIRVAIAYVVGAWVLMQVADATFEPLNLPQWSTTLVLWLLALGFPVALILAWALEVTPEGIRRTKKQRRKPASATKQAPGIQTVHSIAVLPFSDMSPEKDQDHFCEGMAEEIINSLACIQGVQVASRTSSFQFKGTSMDIEAIGERLNVNTVLEGSVRKDGNDLRVTAQLINVADGFHIWSKSFERELKGVFGIQKEIAESVARAFKLSISPSTEKAIEHQPTQNMEAYEAYLRGRRHFYQFNGAEWKKAMVEFSRAIDLDPDYALAYAGLADCYSLTYMYTDTSVSNRQQAETNSRLALQLAPDLAQVHASRALALSFGPRNTEAEQAFEQAIELDPKLFEAYFYYGRHACAKGKFDLAAELFEKAAQLRPDDYEAVNLLVQVYRTLGQKEKRVEATMRSLELITRRLQTTPDDKRALCLGAGRAIEVGQIEKGLDWLERARAAAPDDPVTLYNIACSYAGLGNIEEAIDCLEKSMYAGAAASLEWMENDSDLDPLREHPRYKALVGKGK